MTLSVVSFSFIPGRLTELLRKESDNEKAERQASPDRLSNKGERKYRMPVVRLVRRRDHYNPGILYHHNGQSSRSVGTIRTAQSSTRSGAAPDFHQMCLALELPLPEVVQAGFRHGNRRRDMNPFLLERLAKEEQKRILDEFRRTHPVQRGDVPKPGWLTKTVSGLISSLSMLWDSGGKC